MRTHVRLRLDQASAANRVVKAAAPRETPGPASHRPPRGLSHVAASSAAVKPLTPLPKVPTRTKFYQIFIRLGRDGTSANVASTPVRI